MRETITTRAEALAALQDLTARERAAVRCLIALAWCDGRDRELRPDFTGPVISRSTDGEYARLALPSRTVTRPRVVADPHIGGADWYAVGSAAEGYKVVTPRNLYAPDITPERAAIIADLLANPTETVEVDDDA